MKMSPTAEENRKLQRFRVAEAFTAERKGINGILVLRNFGVIDVGLYCQKKTE